jgi:hypothetical protein
MEFDRTAVEHFVKEFFRQRTSALRRRLEVHQTYWRRFYDSQCHWDSRRGVIERSEAEQIESTSPSPNGACVVTTGESIYRSRYDIRPDQGRWSIHEIDMECALCRVKGASTECSQCAGTGWRNWENLVRLHNMPRDPRSGSLPMEEVPNSDQSSHSAIEQFMNEHFRERTAVHGKESEIFAAFAKRFCSPEFDWTRWGPSAQRSEAEGILNITSSSAGVRVISKRCQSMIM